MNPDGYFEDTWFALLNDQIIRLRYGIERSFLQVYADDRPSMTGDRNFHFDLTRETVVVPPDYVERLPHYTGLDWDIWGLTRMMPGGKWHSCYSEAGLADYRGVQRARGRVSQAIAEAATSGVRMAIKDPRLVFTLPALQLDADVIVLTRADTKVKASMRRHYGPRLFTDQAYEGFQWVSNHFNYQIRPQSFEDYSAAFDAALAAALEGRRSLTVSIDELNYRGWQALEDFLGLHIVDAGHFARDGVVS